MNRQTQKFGIIVERNRGFSKPGDRWYWQLNVSSVSSKNGHGFAASPIEAFQAAQKAAESEGFIAHNPKDDEPCDCALCTWHPGADVGRGVQLKAWTGPVGVKQYADKLRAIAGIEGVTEGTEHVYFWIDGEPTPKAAIDHADQMIRFAGIKGLRVSKR